MKNPKKFILSLYNGDGSFSYSPKNKIANLYSTCFGVMCLDLIGELDKFKDKDKVTKFIKKYQDKKTGYFIDNSCIPKDNVKHNQEYIFLQLTDFAQLALSCLNTKANFNYKFLEKYKSKKKLEGWYYNLNWSNPWLISNNIMFILNCFIYESETKNKKYIDHIIKLLNQTQDSKNGFWNLNKKSSLHNQMAGAYHFIFFYTYLNKKPNFVENIINSTLKIQDFDGLFNYSTGGGSCDDLDAIDLLCRSTFYTNYKKKQIERALLKSYNALLKNQNIDGGFCWAKRNNNIIKLIINSLNLRLISCKDFIIHPLSKIKRIAYIILNKKSKWKYSGLENMELHSEDSDLFSTWFRLTSIAMIEETFPKITKNKSNHWNLRKKCGLGFYKKGDLRE